MTGFIGQWDTRIWSKTPKHHLKLKRDYIWLNKCIGIKPGFINRDRLEWYSLHTHKNGNDLPYQFGYLFSITLDIPEGAKSLLLPVDERIYIMAMTISEQYAQVINAQVLNDKYDF